MQFIFGESSMSDMSSLIPELEPRGRNDGGGGVVVRDFSSLKDSQNSLPLEFRMACCLKLFDRPWERDCEESICMSSERESKRS